MHIQSRLAGRRLYCTLLDLDRYAESARREPPPDLNEKKDAMHREVAMLMAGGR